MHIKDIPTPYVRSIFFSFRYFTILYKATRHIAALCSVFIIWSCATMRPKDFTYTYDKTYTGLDKLIRTDGYYIVQRECDSAFFSIFMFYNDGLFTLATGTDVAEIAECFGNNSKKSSVCDYPAWGTYRIAGDTVKTQTVKQEGVGFATIFRDFIVLPDKSLINISEYANPEKTNIGYMKKYPSFYTNKCGEEARFYPLETKRDSAHCPYLNKGWFSK